MKAFLGVVLVVGIQACGGAPAFQCSDDAACGDGRCEPASGYCSFVDEACASGWKYGAHAATGLAGQCVDPEGATSQAGTGDPTGDGPGPGSTPDDDGDDHGDDDGTTTPAGTGTTLPDPTGADCEAGGTCRAAPPPGWQGPVAVVTGMGAIPSCPSELPTTLEIGHTMLDAAPATCTCGCDPVPGSCDAITITIDETAGTCDTGTPVDLAEDDCVPLVSSATSATVGSPVGSEGTCATNGDVEVAPPVWVDHLRVCTADDAPTCEGDGVCLPSVDAADTCILRAGDVPCPAGPYSDRTVLYGDYLDDRDCSTCQCNVQGPVCRVEMRMSTDCSGTPDVTWTTDVAHCESFDVPVGEDFTAQLDTVDNCAGTGSSPIGAATPVDPTTICCLL